MAKVVPDPLDPSALPRVRGVFYTRAGMRVVIAQKWPRNRPESPNTPYDRYRQLEFGKAARWASSAEPLAFQTAVNLARGTHQLPRDLLLQASYGRLYEIDLPTGESFVNARDMTNNPQWILDLLGSEVGGLIIRDEIGWVILSPGETGQVLAMLDGLPAWVDPDNIPEPEPPPAELEPLFDFGSAGTTGGWGSYTVRTRVPSTLAKPASTGGRVLVQAGSAGLTLNAAYVGLQALTGDQYDFAATPVPILFGGSAAVEVGAGLVLWSDQFALDIPADRGIVLAAQFNEGSIITWTGGSAEGIHGWWKAGQDAATVNAAGYSTSSQSRYVFRAMEILVP